MDAEPLTDGIQTCGKPLPSYSHKVSCSVNYKGVSSFDSAQFLLPSITSSLPEFPLENTAGSPFFRHAARSKAIFQFSRHAAEERVVESDQGRGAVITRRSAGSCLREPPAAPPSAPGEKRRHT